MPLRKIVNKIKKEIKAIKGEEAKSTFFSSQHTYPDETAAKAAFADAKKKLFDIHRWNDLPGLSSKFILYNRNGALAGNKMPAIKDFIKIELPGPFPESWVEITQVVDEEEAAAFTVSPCKAPAPHQEGEEVVEHFFVEEATNTFMVERKGADIFAYEIGKNEAINNQGEESGNRGLINTLIAEGGWMFFQKLQWQKLTDYLVHLID